MKKRDSQTAETSLVDSSSLEPISRVRLPGRGLTRQAAQQRSSSAQELSGFDEGGARVSIPTIRGRTAEKLRREAEARELAADDALDVGPEQADFDWQSHDERGAVALACVMLEQFRRAGGVAVPERALSGALRRLLETFTEEERMALEVEAYEVMEWLGRALDPLPARSEQGVPALEPTPSGRGVLSTLRRAIEGQRDVVIQYFTGGRAELTRRRVTPLRIEAQKYLHAYCHRRQDDRVFRINRIRQVSWVGGLPMLEERPPEPPPPVSPRPARSAPPQGLPSDGARRASALRQMSLLPSQKKR